MGDRALKSSGSSKGGGFEPVRLKEGKVSRVPPVFPARDVALGHAGGEPLCVRDHPIGEQAAAASARDAELFVIDVTALDHFIDAAHEVLIVITGIMILNDVSELLAVGDAAAGIRIKHDVALGRHPLKFVLENPAVSRMRTAVDVQDKRIFLVRVEAGRLLHPRLNLFSVEGLIGDFFRLGQVQLRPELAIDIGELLLLRVGIDEK